MSKFASDYLKSLLLSMKTHSVITIIGWLIAGILLFLWQENYLPFHYEYIEQFRLFHYSSDYFVEHCSYPSGLVEYAATFLIQFFNQPHIGAATNTVLFLLIGIGMQLIFKRIAPRVDMPLAYLLPVLLLLFAGMDLNYHLEGTLSFALTVWFLNLQIRIIRPVHRIISGILLSWFLFYLAGPAFVLFALCSVIYEWHKRELSQAIPVLLLPVAALPACYAYFVGHIDTFRIIFLPDAYTNHKLEAQVILYYSWIALFLLFTLACLLKRWQKPVASFVKALSVSIQILAVIVILYQGNEKYNSSSLNQVKELDYYSRNKKWDPILNLQLSSNNNLLLACFKNMAMAQKGILADKGLYHKQFGNNALWIDWDQTSTVSTLLSDLYYAMGHIALSQRYAFEGVIASEWEVNPYLYLRLIQTNLIFGHYDIAEKYIRFLEDTRYQEQAHAYRKFLNNDSLLEQDTELGGKRKGISAELGLSEMRGLPQDLLQIAFANPENEIVLDYVGMYILFEKNIPLFKMFIENFYQAPGLQPMPTHFQEAIVFSYESHPERWKEFGITEATEKRFQEFKRLETDSRLSPSLFNKLRAGFGNTYWYYYTHHK